MARGREPVSHYNLWDQPSLRLAQLPAASIPLTRRESQAPLPLAGETTSLFDMPFTTPRQFQKAVL